MLLLLLRGDIISISKSTKKKKRNKERRGEKGRKEGKEVFFICVVLFSVIVCFGRDDKVG